MKNKKGDIEKWDQTENPQIPEETSEIPGLPSGGTAKGSVAKDRQTEPETASITVVSLAN